MARDRPTMAGDLPKEAAQLAFWRRGQATPLAFVVKLEDAERIQTEYADMVKNGTPGLLRFDTWNFGNGRKSTTVLDVEHIEGVTSEYATLQLALVGAGTG